MIPTVAQAQRRSASRQDRAEARRVARIDESPSYSITGCNDYFTLYGAIMAARSTGIYSKAAIKGFIRQWHEDNRSGCLHPGSCSSMCIDVDRCPRFRQSVRSDRSSA